MMLPLGLTITRDFQFEEIYKIPLGFTLYLMFYGTCQIPLGFLSDRMSRKTLLSAGIILNGIAVALVAVFHNYTFFLVGLSIAGIGGATFHPIAGAYLSDLYSESKGTALGVSGFGATIGLSAGPVIGGLLCDATNWKFTFVVFSIVAIIVGIIFHIVAVEPEKEKNEFSGSNNGWNKYLIIFLITAAAVFTFREFAGWGVYYLMPVFSELKYSYTTTMSGTMLGLVSLGGFISQ
ncbi:MAG TPA: MFS transporter, partial [Spirochaetota bacterium]|nr:MFS transporter [Spirochaetota bacterium]